MTIIYDEALREYMAKKGLRTIAVEVISTQNSDLDVTELYVHLIPEKRAAYFKEKKHFRAVQGELGELLLPPYHLEYDETIRFFLKKLLFFRSVGYEGIRL
ncbi:MAG: hypothetical protein IKI69_09000 [Oscillospiraceae bacterium]|nr:hypothetical protein [Oscillospiraceae bacterium]